MLEGVILTPERSHTVPCHIHDKVSIVQQSVKQRNIVCSIAAPDKSVATDNTHLVTRGVHYKSCAHRFQASNALADCTHHNTEQYRPVDEQYEDRKSALIFFYMK